MRIALTTGDADGVGLEVTLKALAKLGPQAGFQFILFRQPKSPRFAAALDKSVARKFRIVRTGGLPEALALQPQTKMLIQIESVTSPPQWVLDSGRACFERRLAAMVTAPMSKELIKASGHTAIGHTELLQSVAGQPPVHMSFLGQNFNVVLATGHVAIRHLATELTLNKLELAVRAAFLLRKSLPPALRKKPVALLGLNPHAGEKGIIGSEESALFADLINRLHAEKLPVVGPLVPDAAFLKENWSKYALYVCAYHDQGLIPFKLVHGQESGTHLTLGLPFIRTSVDHGTAKDIFGKNRANASSMLDAIRWAMRLAKDEFHGV